MMRKAFTILILLIYPSIYSQALSNDDFRTLIPYLQQQDFKGAFEKSEALLKQFSTDTTEIKAQIAYVNIYAAAGMVTERKMTYKKFEKNIKKFIGKKLKMSGHPCLSDSVKVAYNSFQFLANEDNVLEGFTMTANKGATNILLFEYYEFDSPVDPKDFVGSNVRAGGVLKSYELSPTQSGLWVARIRISGAYVRGFIPR